MILALTWGGVQYGWASYKVLVPLIIGAAGLVLFMLYEAYGTDKPTIPLRLLKDRTSFAGYVPLLLPTRSDDASLTCLDPTDISLRSFMESPSQWSFFYLPTFFQGAQEASPIRSGILIFTTACLIGTSHPRSCHIVDF